MHDTEEITKKPISIFLYAAQRHLGIHNKLIMLLLGPFCSSDEAGYDSINIYIQHRDIYRDPPETNHITLLQNKDVFCSFDEAGYVYSIN